MSPDSGNNKDNLAKTIFHQFVHFLAISLSCASVFRPKRRLTTEVAETVVDNIDLAETVADSIDLATEILVRLPTKSLLIFKCVSKQWLSLISNPNITVSHTRHHHNTPNFTPTALLLNKTYPLALDFQIIPLKKHEALCKVPLVDYLGVPKIKLQQSCNGLFLCTRCSLLPVTEPLEKLFFICNLTTKKFKQRSFPSHQFKDSKFYLKLDFDPFKSAHYKVISICKVKKYILSTYRIDMYSLETDSWSLLGITNKDLHGIEFEDPVFCNGAIHWVSNNVNSLYFDVNNECLKIMPLPALREGLYYRQIRYFGESCGRLHLIVTYEPSAWQFDVLEMAADYSQWLMRYHVNVRIPMPKPSRYRGKCYPFSVLGVIWAEKEEELTVVLLMNDRAVTYNPYDGTSKTLCDLQRNSLIYLMTYHCPRFKTYQYFETLSNV